MATQDTAGRYVRFFHLSRDPMAIADPFGRFLLVNSAFLELTGYTEAELVARPFIDFVVPEDRERTRAEMQLQVSQRPSLNFENSYRCRDGRSVLLSWTAFFDASDGVTYATARDITASRRAELEMRRTGRALRTLDQCNEALARAKDEQALLTEVCRALVDTGGYRLCWVGWARDDAQRSVEVAAWAGAGGDYVQRVRARWDESEHGRGPTGRCIRERRMVVLRNMHTDPAYAPWRADAIAHGYAASLSAPLFAGEQVLGALMVYAADPEAFDAEEQRLIGRLAEHLAFGVSALRARSEAGQARSALRRQEDYYRALIEYSSDVVAILDPTLNLRFVSSPVERLLGYRPEELTGRSALALVHPADIPNVAALVRQAFAGLQAASVAVRIRHKDGGWRVHEAVGRNLLGEPAVRGIVLNLRDITGRVEAERALVDSETRYRRVIETAEEGVWQLDADDRTSFMNDKMAALLGWSLEDMLGRPVADFVPPEDWPEVEKKLASRRERTGRYDVRLRRRDGGDLWVLVRTTPIRDDAGAYLGALAMCTDITARREAEERLRRSEERFRALIERASDVVVVLEADGKLQYATPSIQRVLGYGPDELVGADMLALVHPDDVADVRAKVAVTASDRSIVGQAQYRYRHKDGSWRLLQSVGVNLLDVPAVRGLVATSRDITEQHQLEAQLHQSQRLDAIGRLAGGVAHDFNNILTVIRTSAELLLGELRPGDPLRPDAEEIVRSSDRAAALTRHLLAFSRRQVLQPRVLEVDAIVQDLERMLRRLIGEDIELVLKRGTAPLPVRADQAQLEQVIMNLAVNARDAMPRGGQLRIVTGTLMVSDADLAARPGRAPGRYVAIAVQDTGSGIARDVRERIFEPFFTTKTHGTGLGLPTVYGIVQQSGGFIMLDSEPGVGTTFTVCLPQAVEEPAAAEPPRRRSGEHRGSEVVVLTEDDAAVRGLVHRSLAKLGYRVLDADGAEAALDLARHHEGRIDLLLTDVVMPGRSGRDLAVAFGRLRPDARVAYMSGYADRTIEGGLPPDAVLIEKPFTPELLGRRLREALDAPVRA